MSEVVNDAAIPKPAAAGAEDEDYHFGRDFLSSARLNLQHYLWRETLGYYLHPHIPVPTSQLRGKEFRVAEIGTGTGIWLSSLLLSLPPEANFSGTGIDLSPGQFSHAALGNPRLSFVAHDAMTPPPPELRGTFDVVHLRLLWLVMGDQGPAPFLRCARELLRPGGWIQWDEYENSARRVESRGGNPAPANERLCQSVVAAKPVSWIASLDDMLRDFAFEHVELYRCRPPTMLLRAFSEMMLVSQLEHAAALDRKGADGDEWRKLVTAGGEELKHGSVHSHLIQVVVGRKMAD